MIEIGLIDLSSIIGMIVEANPGIDFDGIVQIIGTPQEISKTFEDNESLRNTALIVNSFYFWINIFLNKYICWLQQ